MHKARLAVGRLGLGQEMLQPLQRDLAALGYQPISAALAKQ